MRNRRSLYIDFLRGFGVFLMLITHVNGLFLLSNAKPLDYLTYLGATVCFVIFLFCFGFVYGYKIGKNEKISVLKHIKKSASLLAVYYLCAIAMEFFLKGSVNTKSLLDIILFRYQVAYTEFILTLFIYSVVIAFGYDLLAYLLNKNKKRSVITIVSSILISLILYALSYNVAKSDISFFAKEIITGKYNVNSFAILPYLPILIYGIVWGFVGPSKKLAKRYERVLVWSVFISSGSILTVIKILDLSRWERFPPSLLYMLAGITLISGVISLRKYVKKLKFITRFLTFFGQNSLLAFILNVFYIGGLNWILYHRKFDSNVVLFLNLGVIFAVSISIWLVKKVALSVKKTVIFLCALIIALISFLAIILLGIDLRKAINPLAPQIDKCADFVGYPDDILTLDLDKSWIIIEPEADYTQTITVTFDMRNKEYLQDFDKINISYMILGTDIFGQFSMPKEQADDSQIYLAEIYLADLDPGEYQINVAAHFPCEIVQLKTEKFFISYPLYVTWTHDWEGADVQQSYLDDIANISDKYGIPLSHYFNPHIYVPGVMSNSRSTYLTNWVISRRDNNGDSIGLHLHMFPQMVTEMLKPTEYTVMESRQVEQKDEFGNVVLDENGNPVMTTVQEPVIKRLFEPRYTPTWGGYRGIGEDIPVSAYTYDELMYIFDWSIDKFEEKKLGRPIGFRAGGWFANMITLKALQDSGFKYDTSGRTFEARGINKMKLPWNLQPTTQPYKPNVSDQNSSASPNLTLWELPNNGADSWVYSGAQMRDRFDANWKGGYLEEKKLVVFLSHPHWFYVDKPKIEELFAYTSGFSAKEDKGPVVYINMDNAYKIWAE